MKLVELRTEYRNILEAIEASCDDGGQVDPALMQTLNGVLASIQTKLENYAGLIVHLKAQQEILDHEAERLSKQSKSAGAHIDFLKDHAKAAMHEAGFDKLEVGVRKLRIQANGGMLPLTIKDAAKVIETYWEQPPRIVDTVTLRKALEAGVPVEGAELGERGSHLRVS